MQRIGVVAIIVEGDRGVALEVQKLLSEFAAVILGRMGIPDREDNVSAIAVIVRGTTEQISALTGKLGRLTGVSVKSALAATEIGD